MIPSLHFSLCPGRNYIEEGRLLDNLHARIVYVPGRHRRTAVHSDVNR